MMRDYFTTASTAMINQCPAARDLRGAGPKPASDPNCAMGKRQEKEKQARRRVASERRGLAERRAPVRPGQLSPNREVDAAIPPAVRARRAAARARGAARRVRRSHARRRPRGARDPARARRRGEGRHDHRRARPHLPRGVHRAAATRARCTTRASRSRCARRSTR